MEDLKMKKLNSIESIEYAGLKPATNEDKRQIDKYLDEDFETNVYRAKELKTQMDKLKKELEQYEGFIKDFMICNNIEEQYVDDFIKVSYKEVSTNRIDSKKLKEHMPNVYEDFCTTTVSNRLTIR